MSYDALFTRFGCPSDEGRVNITGYFLKPEKLNADRIRQYDEAAARVMKEAQDTINALASYRKGLADRYAQLSTAPYTLRLELERHRESWRDGKVFYYIRISKIYEDGTTVRELSETYKGTERREALARFEALKKQRPGIEAVKNIEKGKWER